MTQGTAFFFFFNKEEVDVPTMQLAWEFLELARIVFVRFVSQLLYFYIKNCIAQWRLGAWDIQQLPLLAASSQMENVSHGWQILATQP